MPITGTVADSDNGVNKAQNVRDKDDDHNHIEEVIHSNNDHPEHPVITGQLEQPVNRR